jgi:hypothetical protein
MAANEYVEQMLEMIVRATRDAIYNEKASRMDRDPIERAKVVGWTSAVYQMCDMLLNWAAVYGVAAEGIRVPDFDPEEELLAPWSPSSSPELPPEI